MTGMEVGAKQINAKVANGAILGCGLVAGAISKRYPMMPRPWAVSCPRRVNHVVAQELRRANPQMVVWLSGWELNDLDLGDHDAVQGTPEHDQVLLDRLEALYRRTRAPGRKIVILTLPVESPGKYLPRPDPELGKKVQNLNAIYRLFAARHPDDIAIVDLAAHVCPTGQPCSPVRDGLEPRPLDGIHFTAEGSAWAARWIWPQLLAVWPQPASG